MWKIIDNKTLKLELKKMRNQTNKIAHFRDCTKINIVGNQMELETQKTSLKDSINELKGIVNKLCSEFIDFKNKTNKKLNKIDTINKRLNKIDKRLSNIEKLPTIAKELSELK